MVDDITIQSSQGLISSVSSGSAKTDNSKVNADTETSFAETLSQTQNLRFSNHAQKRLESRNISLTADFQMRLIKQKSVVEKNRSLWLTTWLLS
jgi:hypothetical protein